jgi:hypothetical protein
VANPTTNYGFVLPTPTDLVTDLPADFDVALQGVDTRLKALQPGTTLGDLAYSSATSNTNTRLAIGTSGQVLAVSGGGVPAWTTTADVTPLTTKGDLFTFTTADARLAVGTNNTILVANSATASGLEWQTLGAFTNFTPTWNAGVTVGNSTQSFSYATSGKIGMVQGAIRLGSTGSFTAMIRMAVPFAFTLNTDMDAQVVLGKWTAYDDSTGIMYTGSIFPQSGDLRFYADAPDAVAGQTKTQLTPISNTVPFTWTTSDRLIMQYFIRAS